MRLVTHVVFRSLAAIPDLHVWYLLSQDLRTSRLRCLKDQYGFSLETVWQVTAVHRTYLIEL